MAQIAYLLLCHKDPERIAEQALRLVANGDRVAIHFDGRAPLAEFAALQARLADEPSVVFVTPRIKCGWGEWSLVAATLATLRRALAAFPAATHTYLISGECMPVKPAGWIRQRLLEDDRDWITAEPFATSDFIKTGFREDRLIYRHWFNERTAARRFYASYRVQKALGLIRKTPDGVTIMIGSQWWCLRRATAERVLQWIAKRPDVPRFFRTTWIPDETFFQTIVRHLVPANEISGRTPTFLHFTDYGLPVTFHDDHYAALLAEDAFFARKIGSDATELLERLGHLYGGKQDTVPAVAATLRRLHGVLARQGRVGQRHGPRRWEAGGMLGQDRRLTVVVCKKWHVGKRLLSRMGGGALGYVFDEEEAGLPDTGGAGATLDARQVNRRAFLALVADLTQTRHLAIGLDPSRTDVLEDLERDQAHLSVLDLDCDVSDAYLEGHASRIGLPTGDLANAVIPALRAEVRRERAVLRHIAGPRHFTVSERATRAENSATLAAALGIDREKALQLLGDDLFDD